MSGMPQDFFLRLVPVTSPIPHRGINYSIHDLLSTPVDHPLLDLARKPRKVVNGGIALGRRYCGSMDANDVDLFSAPVISRNHAQITVTPSADVFVTDLGSLHGTHIQHPGHQPFTLEAYKHVQLLQDDVLVLGKSISYGPDAHMALKMRVELKYPNSTGAKRTVTELQGLIFAKESDLPLMMDWLRIKGSAPRSAQDDQQSVEPGHGSFRNPGRPTNIIRVPDDSEEEQGNGDGSGGTPQASSPYRPVSPRYPSSPEHAESLSGEDVFDSDPALWDDDLKYHSSSNAVIQNSPWYEPSSPVRPLPDLGPPSPSWQPVSPVAVAQSPRYEPPSPDAVSPRYAPPSPVRSSPLYTPDSPILPLLRYGLELPIKRPRNPTPPSPLNPPVSPIARAALTGPEDNTRPYIWVSGLVSPRLLTSPVYAPSSPPGAGNHISPNNERRARATTEVWQPPSPTGYDSLRASPPTEPFDPDVATSHAGRGVLEYGMVSPILEYEPLAILEQLPPSSPIGTPPVRSASARGLARQSDIIVERPFMGHVANRYSVDRDGRLPVNALQSLLTRIEEEEKGDDNGNESDDALDDESVISPKAMKRVKDIIDSIDDESDGEGDGDDSEVGAASEDGQLGSAGNVKSDAAEVGDGEERITNMDRTGLGVWYSYSEGSEDGRRELQDGRKEDEDEDEDDDGRSSSPAACHGNNEDMEVFAEVEGEVDELDSPMPSSDGALYEDGVGDVESSQPNDQSSEHEHDDQDEEEEVKVEDIEPEVFVAPIRRPGPRAEYNAFNGIRSGHEYLGLYANASAPTRAAGTSSNKTISELWGEALATSRKETRKTKAMIKTHKLKPTLASRMQALKQRVAATQNRGYERSKYSWAPLDVGVAGDTVGEAAEDGEIDEDDIKEEAVEEDAEGGMIGREDVGDHFASTSVRAEIASEDGSDSESESGHALLGGETKGESDSEDEKGENGSGEELRDEEELSSNAGVGDDEELYSIAGVEDIEDEDVEDRSIATSDCADGSMDESEDEDGSISGSSNASSEEDEESSDEVEVSSAAHDSSQNQSGGEGELDVQVEVHQDVRVQEDNQDNITVSHDGAEHGSPFETPIQTHHRTSSTSSAESSAGPITPPNLKRKLSDEIAIQTETEEAPVLKMPRLDEKERPARNLVKNLGLVMLGAVVGSVGTVVGLMQLAE